MPTFKELTESILSRPNVSMRCEFGFVQDLHRFVQIDIGLVESNPDPKNSKQCIAIKENLLYIVRDYDKIKKNAPNIKWK